MRARTRPESSPGLPLPLWLLLAVWAAGVGGHERRTRGLPGLGRTSPTNRGRGGWRPAGGRFGRERRQAVRAYVGMESSTPANLERASGSSQYPWAIVWGPTAADEASTDPTDIETAVGNPGGARARHGLGTAHTKSRTIANQERLNLRETPATLTPVLFGRATQGTDPQVYVTVTVSILIIVAAIGIILKFCWDRNWPRRHETTRNRGMLTEDSRQALTGGPGLRRGLFGAYRDSRAQSPDSEPTSPTELVENLDFEGNGVRFHRNR
uniref:PILR alpha-associated neural protein n=1 Tax=Pristiophorus japonicus TaxID=55135 RepID=UPI00398F8BCB